MTVSFYNCLQNCSGFEADWSFDNLCNIYNSMACSKHQVENFSCRPECLWSCPDVFCDSFSSLVYACDSSYDLNGYFNKTVTEMQCLSAVSSTAPTLTRFQWRIELELKNVDPAVMAIDEAAQEAVTMSISLSLSGIPVNRVSFINTFPVTAFPSGEPTATPSAPSSQPSTKPSSYPSGSPSSPSGQPSVQPTALPSETDNPTQSPSTIPSRIPTHKPTGVPSTSPTYLPSSSPSYHPSAETIS